MSKIRVETTYEGNAEDYVRNKIPGARAYIANNESTPDKQKEIQSLVLPYGISVVAGIPLYRSHDLQTDYEIVTHDLREMMPNQFPYDNGRTHVALGVFVRNSPGSGNGEFELRPEGRRGDFYLDYLEVFRNVDFSPFSLKVEGFYPNGIMLLTPKGNPEEVFNIRRQLSQGLLDKKVENPEFYFTKEKDGVQPKIDSGIVHTTALRFANKPELQKNWKNYIGYLGDLNSAIRGGKMFSEPIVVDEISMIEPKVNRDISKRYWYNDVVVERRAFNDMPSERRIRSIDDMAEIAGHLKAVGKKIITTNGSYDIMHAGHIGILERAKAEGDVLIVLINSDSSIRENKGPERPFISEENRARMMASQSPVDYVVVFPENKPLDALVKIKGNVHVKGGSWNPELLREEIEFVTRWGGEYKTFPLEKGLSTTALVDKIRGTDSPSRPHRANSDLKH